MAESKSTLSIKDLAKKYISEVLIIFIGISISFLFDEWRDNRKDHETAHKNLTFLRSNLVKDTLILTGMMKMDRNLARSVEKLCYFKQDDEILDSINFYIDNSVTYMEFKANMMAYEEIKQNAQTSLIENDSLKIAFLSYYTSIVPYCNEWCTVEKTQILNELIPELSNYLPIVEDKFNVVSAKEKAKALKIKKVRNLMLTNLGYKQATINAMDLTKNMAKKLIKRIDKVLEK
jgi:hypothetical protein